MRQPDLNRVKRAREHLKAALTVLKSVKWENVPLNEYQLVMAAKARIGEADWPLADIVNLQQPEP